MKDPQIFRNFGGNHRCYCHQRLAPASAEVILGSESFMAGLNDNELGDVSGSMIPTWYAAALDVSVVISFFANK